MQQVHQLVAINPTRFYISNRDLNFVVFLVRDCQVVMLVESSKDSVKNRALLALLPQQLIHIFDESKRHVVPDVFALRVR